MNNKKKSWFQLFTTICACVMLAAAIYLKLFWPGVEIDGGNLLLQILITSAICSFGVFIYPENDTPKKKYIILSILNYIYTNVVVLGTGLLWKWFLIQNLNMVLGMVVAIALVYFSINIIIYQIELKEAKKMNKILEKRGIY
jgi:hypothetical protein